MVPVVRPFAEQDFDVLVARWHATNLATYPYVEEQQRHTLEEARAFFRAHVLGECEVHVAEVAGELAGLMALTPGWVRQLAVFPSFQRRGIGAHLLLLAQERWPAELHLHTFQRNTTARAFYETHGFRAVAFGVSKHPENEPDVLYCWPPERADRRSVPVHRAAILDCATVATVDRYWAGHLGCSVEELSDETPRIIRHGAELAGYGGILAFFRGGAPIVSVPAGSFDTLRELLEVPPHSTIQAPVRLAAVLSRGSDHVIGPAFLGYTDYEHLTATKGGARLLGAEDQPAARSLRDACGKVEWEHGGSLVGQQSTAGVFVEGRLAALAGYEVWGGSIAHLSVITHPDFRSRRVGRKAVGCLARHALSIGLVPQYRTLDANAASIRVAEALGFVRLATTIAARPWACAAPCG
jgi:ribosomal protein S18 acetylase RimI-like enzyme